MRPPARRRKLFHLTRESLKRHQLDEIWKAKRATSPKSLAAVLSSPAVADAIRKELRRKTKQNVDVDEITRLLRETVTAAPEKDIPLPPHFHRDEYTVIWAYTSLRDFGRIRGRRAG